MRCEEIRQTLEELTAGEAPAVIREHLAACSHCRAYGWELKLVRMGFRALGGEEVPEASLGFATRLVRRLGEAAGAAAPDFFERAGRRVVLATLVLTLTVLLALAWPAAGPLRGGAAADLAMAQAELTPPEDDPLFSPDYQDSPEVAPARLAAPGGKEKP